jgi:23S rRNA (uracil1939-C5)-methyltransferase
MQADPKPPKAVEAAPVTLDVRMLGARGDGVAGEGAAPIYVPGALAGERVEVEISGDTGRLLQVFTPSPDRIEPICPLFGSCGGCAAQHLADGPYANWKRGIVADALRRAGLETDVRPLLDGHGTGRRRVTLHGRRQGARALAGFMRARSHDLIEVTACPVLDPSLARAPAIAAAVTAALADSDKPLTILVTATLGGLDVDVRGLGAPRDSQRVRLTALAGQLDLARLSIHGDTIVTRREPLQRMGKAVVSIPPGGFLQPTLAGEAVLGDLVIKAVEGVRRVVDLFAGSGPFALRLAEKAEVLAVESDMAALRALDRAARATPGLRRITVETRDLFRRPLLAAELKAHDAVVLDPPRAGALAACEQLAMSNVPVVAYVSCDVGSFARDAALLVQGGYTLEEVTPVDQFRYSHHVELVGRFVKARPRKR